MKKVKLILVTIILLLTMYYTYRLGQQQGQTQQQAIYKQEQMTKAEREEQISKEIAAGEKVTGDTDKLITNTCC